MISITNKFIFVHIPKTAGVSLYLALFSKEHKPAKFPCKGGVLGWNHESLEQIESGMRNLNIDTESFYKFTVIRNPWDKILSSYLFWKNMSPSSKIYDKDQSEYMTKHNLSFKDFCMCLNDDVPIFCNTAHCQPQLDFFIKTPDSFNKILRFENLQSGIQEVLLDIHLTDVHIPHYNKTSHKHYSEYYDEETREIVAQKYAKDIEYFGYKFESLK